MELAMSVGKFIKIYCEISMWQKSWIFKCKICIYLSQKGLFCWMCVVLKEYHSMGFACQCQIDKLANGEDQYKFI